VARESDRVARTTSCPRRDARGSGLARGTSLQVALARDLSGQPDLQQKPKKKQGHAQSKRKWKRSIAFRQQPGRRRHEHARVAIDRWLAFRLARPLEQWFARRIPQWQLPQWRFPVGRDKKPW
jgi:hypothetical protein